MALVTPHRYELTTIPVDSVVSPLPTYWSRTGSGHLRVATYIGALTICRPDPGVWRRRRSTVLFRASVDRKPRKYIPDYLLIMDTGPVVMDVKPGRRLVDPEVAFTFEWTRENR
jgi:hypothetical protein